MNQAPPSRPGWSPLGVFLLLFSLVFFVVVVTATMVTFILPESYAGTARIEMQWTYPNSTGATNAQSPLKTYDPYFIQTQFEIIQSELILRKVIEEQDLNSLWGKKYYNGEKLKTTDTITILKGRMTLRPISNTSIIAIQVFSEDRDEAATLANKVAEVFAEYARSMTNGLRVEIIDIAHPALRPTRPNKPLNIVLGMVIGVVLGALVGGVGAALAHSRWWKSQRPPAIP